MKSVNIVRPLVRTSLPESGRGRASGAQVANSVSCGSCSRECDFEVGVGIAPKEGQACQPILALDCFADASAFFRWQKAGGCLEFRPGDFSADGAGRDLDVRAVANALALPEFTVCHEIQLVVIFGKPDGGVNGYAVFSEGGEADIPLAVDFCGNGYHEDIVNCCQELS